MDEQLIKLIYSIQNQNFNEILDNVNEFGIFKSPMESLIEFILKGDLTNNGFLIISKNFEIGNRKDKFQFVKKLDILFENCEDWRNFILILKAIIDNSNWQISFVDLLILTYNIKIFKLIFSSQDLSDDVSDIVQFKQISANYKANKSAIGTAFQANPPNYEAIKFVIYNSEFYKKDINYILMKSVNSTIKIFELVFTLYNSEITDETFQYIVKKISAKNFYSSAVLVDNIFHKHSLPKNFDSNNWNKMVEYGKKSKSKSKWVVY